MSDTAPDPVIGQCYQAFVDAGPLLEAPDAHWVMNLDAYKRIRALAVPYRDDPDGDDPDEWEPGPDDRLMAMPIEVREDGGEPHLVSEMASGRLP